MAKTTLNCNKCEWSTTKPSQIKAEQSLRMHTGRKHGEVQPYKNHPADAELPRQKRKYTRRAKVALNVAVNFCPGCGCDLHAVAMGLALGGRGKA